MTQTAAITAEGRTLLALGIPLIGSQIAQFGVHTADTIMLGWYAIDALAQVALGSQVYFIAFILGSGFAWAILPMVAQAAEEKDFVRVRRVTRMGLWTATIGGLVLMLPMWFSKPILLALGQDPMVTEGAQTYLRIAGWGIIPFLWSQVLRSYLSALEHTAITFWVAVGVLVGNVIVNYLLIFGNWGFPELGIVGAAIASLSVSILSFVGFAIYVIRVFPEHDMFSRFWKADMAAIKEVTTLALPISGVGLAESGMFAASTFILGMIGTAELAAGGIVIQPAALTFMFHLGLSQASTVRTGQAMARRDRDELTRIATAAAVMSAVFALIVVAVFIIFRDPIVRVFLDMSDPKAADVLRVGVGLMILAAAFQLVDAAQVQGLGMLRGMQDTTVPMILATISYWMIGMPIAYCLGLFTDLGAYGVWMGLVAGLTAAAVLLWWRYFGLLKKL